MVRRAGWAVFGLLLLLGLAWVLFRPGAAPPNGRMGDHGPVPVLAGTAVKGEMPVTINALGTVTPLATVTVRTQINGQLVQVAFQEGQSVTKGDFLAQIDPRPYQNALDQSQGQLLRDQALERNAELDLQRYRKLLTEDSIARQQVDTQESLVHQYDGVVKTDQALVENAKLNLAYCHIVAPITGRVGLRQVDPGNYVQISDANGIVVITETKPISVIFTVPEDNVPAILRRLHSGSVLPVTAFDRTRVNKLASGALTTLDNQIDTSTGTVKLRAQFANDDEILFPNQFVNAELLVDSLSDAVIAPTAAIQRGAPGTFVYVVNPDGTVAVRPVKLGPGDGQRVAVTDGLVPGDKIVIDGADKLRDGAKVALREAAPGGDQAAPRGGVSDHAGRPHRGNSP